MTQDLLMCMEEPIVPTQDAALNQLQQLCAQAKTAQQTQLLDLIRQALEMPSIYVFAELLMLPNVQELQTGAHAKYFNTLNLFAYGNYKQYRQNQADYLELTPAMLKKLQHLTIVSLAIKAKSISYDVLLQELELQTVRELEDLIIEAIYADMIRGKLFQNNRFLEVDYAQGRDIPPGYTKIVAQTLQDWSNSCDAISNCLASQVERANLEKAKRLQNEERIEQETIKLKKQMKNSVNDIDEIKIDSCEPIASTSTSAAAAAANAAAAATTSQQENRKKPTQKTKSARPAAKKSTQIFDWLL